MVGFWTYSAKKKIENRKRRYFKAAVHRRKLDSYIELSVVEDLKSCGVKAHNPVAVMGFQDLFPR